MALSIGDNAPTFTLFDTDKKSVSLSDFAGKPLLLLFFPAAFTGVCTAELCSVRDKMPAYDSAHVQVAGISVDSLFVLGKFKEDQSYNFPLLSDFNKTASTDYGCLYDTFVFDMEGVSKRSAFLVDGSGKIAYAEVLESAGDQPNFEAIQEAILSLN